MKRLFLVLFLLVLTATFEISLAADLNTFFKSSDSFIKKYVHGGRVAYGKISQQLPEAQRLYDEIENMDISGASAEARKAFYINAYNVIVIYQVAKYYPLKSALDQSGFFDRVKHKVAGESMTLNFLEIKKLVLEYKDPLIHFALACAAESCPPLASFAYLPGKLDSQLMERTRLSLNDKDWIKVDPAKKTVAVSKIFDWYKKDFASTGKSTIAFINSYRSKPIPNDYKVEFYTYDWSLNEE